MRMVGIDKQKAAVVLTGPPATRDLDSDVVRQLMQTGATRIVCGGTTSKIVSNYTRSPVHVDLTTVTTEIPPIARIDGLDLVTEGIVTLTRVRDMLADGVTTDSVKREQDAASRLLALLLYMEHVHFIVGTAKNPVHNDINPDREFEDRATIVRGISELLEQHGIAVSVESV
jgi:hypothetical protein